MNKTLVLAAAALAASLSAQDPSAPAPTPAPTNWKDLTRYGLPIKFYGFFRFDTYYNTARMDNVVIPSRVQSETKRNDDQFHMDPRLTRFGFDVKPEPVGGCQLWGKLEIDFANFPTATTPAESRATPRIRLAFLDIAQDEFGLRVGQDWDVISPLYPAVNNELLMWNAGNLGDRRAQIQGRYAPKDGKFDLKAALGLTGAVNNQDLDTPAGERDGFDSGMPHLQVRAGTKPFAMVEKKPVELGVWGLFGRIETDTSFNGETRFDEWALGLDLQFPLCDTLTLRGEVWTGENLGDVRGGIGQTINITTGREIGSTGGWGELVYAYSPKTKFHVGGTMDDPDNSDLAATNPKRNLSGYAGTNMKWESGLMTGLDAIFWQTEYVGALDGNGIRFDLWFQFDF